MIKELAEKGQDSVFEDWKNAFHGYVNNASLNTLLPNIENELNIIGWPNQDAMGDMAPEQQKNEISHCASNLIRLQKITCDLKVHQYFLERYYKYMFFLKIKEDNLKSGTKEDKKVYAELELFLEKNLTKNIELLIERIDNLNQAYKSRYNGISRIHSIVSFELEMSKR